MEEITMTTFRANDGKMFTNEEECREYESELVAKKVGEQISLFDGKRQPLPVTAQATEEAYYARIDTEKAFNWFKDALDEREVSISGLCWYGKPDVYLWDAHNIFGYSWLSWNKIVKGIAEYRDALIQAGILNAVD